MKSIKNVCSLLSFGLILYGLLIGFISFANGSSFINIHVLIAVILGVAVNCLFTIKEGQKNKVLAVKYFFFNGAIWLCYVTIILIPLGKMIKNKLPASFDAWLRGEVVTVSEKKKVQRQIQKDSISSKQRAEIKVLLELEEFEDWQ